MSILYIDFLTHISERSRNDCMILRAETFFNAIFILLLLKAICVYCTESILHNGVQFVISNYSRTVLCDAMLAGGNHRGRWMAIDFLVTNSDMHCRTNSSVRRF